MIKKAKKNKKITKDEKENAEPKAPDVTSKQKETILTDFRSAVELEPGAEIGDVETKEETKNVVVPKIPPLNMANRLVIRCIACGHFLFEVIADRAYNKALCRQAECKALNEVTVEGQTVHITVTRREQRERGTMRY